MNQGVHETPLQTTQTGIPIALCEKCDHLHPTTGRHCTNCGRRSMFLNNESACLTCEPASTRPDAIDRAQAHASAVADIEPSREPWQEGLIDFWND